MDTKMLLIQIPGFGMQIYGAVYSLQRNSVDILDLNLDVLKKYYGENYVLALDEEPVLKQIDSSSRYWEYIRQLCKYEVFCEFIKPYHDLLILYELFGVSLFGDWCEQIAFNLAAYLKSIRPDAIICIGGCGIQDYYPDSASKMVDKGFDLVVNGDGQEQISELLRSRDPQKCFSTVFKSGNDLFITSNKEILPKSPEFHENFLKYPYPQIVTVFQNTGCYYGRCSFCSEKSYIGGDYFKYSNEIIIHQMKELKAKGLPQVFLGGSGIRKSELRNFLEEVNKYGDEIPMFSMESRAFEFDEEMSLLLKNSKCTRIQIGLESPNEQICNTIYNKGINLKGFFRGLKLLERVGFRRISINIVISSLFQKQQDLDYIIEFLNSYNCIMDYTIYPLFIQQGSNIENIVSKKIKHPLVKSLDVEECFTLEHDASWYKDAVNYITDSVKKPFILFDIDFCQQRSILLNDENFDYYQSLHYRILKDCLDSRLQYYFSWYDELDQ